MQLYFIIHAAKMKPDFETHYSTTIYTLLIYFREKITKSYDYREKPYSSIHKNVQMAIKKMKKTSMSLLILMEQR